MSTTITTAANSCALALAEHAAEHAATGLGSNRGRFVFVGDSLTFASAFRAPGLFDGRPWWSSTPTLTNLGGGNWIIAAQVDGRAPSGAAGTLQTDGAGRVQWAYTGDTYGPYVDCSAGGWFMLQSGSSSYGCLITVRGATTPPASAGTGAVTTAGIPQIGDCNLIGFPAWTAGALGDTFDDYQPWGITGATSNDLLKYVSQVFVYPADAACLLIGTNDAPATAAAANVTIANIKAAIDYASTKVRMLYVGDIFPSTAASATVQKYLSLVSATLREYCKTKINCRFWSAYDYLVSPTALAITQKTGAFHTDQLHLMPYGGYLASLDLVRLIQQDFPTNRTRKSGLDVFDATVGTGAWNANHTLRGTGGTVTALHGVTGTCPDSWTITRSTGTGGSQACTTSFDTASDGGLSWWSMAVSGAAAGEYHELSQVVTVPAGIAAGDYFRVLAELNVDSTTAPGVAVFAIQANGNGNLNAAYLVQTSRNISTFSTEKPALQLQSEPQILISGTTSFTLRIRVGAAASGGVGKIGFRNFRVEKCAGPVYP